MPDFATDELKQRTYDYVVPNPAGKDRPTLQDEQPAGQHVYHHTVAEPSQPKISVKMKNGKNGVTWDELSVYNVSDIDTLMTLVEDMVLKLEQQFSAGATPG